MLASRAECGSEICICCLVAHHMKKRDDRIDLPADIWRQNERTHTHGFFADQPVTKVVIDPDAVMADVDTTNNAWTGQQRPTT